ncbi:hypothetical protein QWY75_07715 [Pontixanthobacter aestiaquae]|uniref:Uncharacterized protein n=1 Tax=Pontixanthobacter aestiaquae TaxID=1509367 RepID=A0A844Z765_9SPHN|nr:hypothetical protein [Pontixanthobacter aestiaquae]MDN3646091.1 hypothetical protein [Pontixanthobacter aestiaquae]MXO82917.1 hypothetical protein [Pontixanthobacter aestiaquae]
MRTLGLFLSGAAFMTLSYPVAAQDAAEDAAEPVCELHVYPTIEGQAQNIGLFGPGLINSAINSDKNISNAEYMREALSPRFQVDAFKTIDVAASVGMPEGTEVIYQTPIADRDITTKVKTRLSDSTEACYAELIVTQNLYQKKMIYGRSLNNRFIFKDFRGGKEKTKMVKGRGGNGISEFPPKTVEDRPAADADLRQAFLANFDEYSKRFRK